MKILASTLLFSICCLSSLAAADTPLFEPTQNPDATYRLFRTTNIWTFIELNTQDGRMRQVHFDVSGDNRMVVDLSDEPLVKGSKLVSGRFTLYPTTNIYNFILLDQVDGRTWQVQWSFDPKNRGIVSIGDMD